MAPRKSERILNLTICLLSARRYLTREQIREAVEGYGGLADAAFERMFERDKDELRTLGVPVETGTQSTYFGDELGYRIPRADFELPPIEFTAEEAAVVSMAVRVWQEANLAESTQLALAKLRAAGLAHTAEAELLAPTSTARVAAFEPLWQALVDGRRVRFDYQRAGAQPVTRRQVEPWGIVSHKGNWYLIGHDIDRADVRMFKLARIVDEPVADGPAGMVQVPESLDLRALAERLEPGQPTGQAVLAIRVGRAPWLRRQGSPVTVEGPGAGLPGFETYAVGFGALDGFATDLAALGSDVLVLEPPELRALVRRHLAGVGGRTAQICDQPRRPRAPGDGRHRGRRAMSTKSSGKGGKEQVPRLLSLVPYLQRRPGARVADVATEFGITPAQLRKDLAVLYMCGLPGLLPGDLIEIDMEAVDGDGVIFLTNAEFLARPLRLSPAEVLPLILGLRTLREVAGSDALASIDSALAKLGSVAGDSVELADRIRIGVRAADEPVREAISTALGAGVRLRLTYESPNRGLSTRLVDPHSLRMRDGYAYLEAWGDPVDPHSEGGWRSFRLDRIVEAEVTGDPVVARPGEPDPPDGWLDRLSTAAEVVLDLDQPATWVAEYYPIAESTPRPGGGLRVRLRVADPAWLRGLLLRLGADATVVSPAGAQQSAVAEAEAAEAHYATLFGADGMP